MFQPNLRHKVALLLLGAFLIASMASAGDLRGPAARPISGESFQPERLLSWLVESLSALWGKEGGGFDPFGLNVPPSPPAVNKAGAEFDPFGLHVTPPPPSNTTSSGNSGEAGPGFDPFG